MGAVGGASISGGVLVGLLVHIPPDNDDNNDDEDGEVGVQGPYMLPQF